VEKEISAILFKIDPVGINYEHNTDEYDYEAKLINDRLKFGGFEGVNDFSLFICGVFYRSFNGHLEFKPEHCLTAAYEIWNLIHKECYHGV
jgi:hypothetical protein